MVEECIFLEETSHGPAPIHAYVIGLATAQTYLRHGTEDQKKRILGNLCAGNFEAIALSEPGPVPTWRVWPPARSATATASSSTPEDLDHRRISGRPPAGPHSHRPARGPARGPDVDVRADRQPRASDRVDPDDGRPHRQRRVLHRRRGPGGQRRRRHRRRLAPTDARLERRAADCRGDVPRRGPPFAGGHHRLRPHP